jgi:putative Ca2+/H+ antiporter (TMEM165/GDT1 family)
MIGLSTALVAWAMWWGAVRFESVAVPLGMVSAVLFAICAIASLVGLSDPRPISGRWMGFASLVLFLAAIAVFVGKLWIHTRSGS